MEGKLPAHTLVYLLSVGIVECTCYLSQMEPLKSKFHCLKLIENKRKLNFIHNYTKFNYCARE